MNRIKEKRDNHWQSHIHDVIAFVKLKNYQNLMYFVKLYDVLYNKTFIA